LRTGVLAAAGLAYVLLAAFLAMTRRPWVDEGWFANPALTMIADGSLRTPIVAIHGGMYEGLALRTYWMPPLYFVAQAGWYRLVGFGLLAMRTLSIAWGAGALLAWFVVLKRLFRDGAIAVAGTALLAVDYAFLLGASDGRMDMMSAALGLAGLAAYLALRERRLGAALLVSNTLIAASGLTHPNGILALGALAVTTVYLDRGRLRPAHLIPALAPYAAAGLAWGAYIAHDPALFRTQFFGNAGGRLGGLTAPWLGIWREIRDRYLSFYGLGLASSVASRAKLVILAAYAGAIVAGLRPAREGVPGFRLLLLLVAWYLAAMALVIGTKTPMYLVHVVPLLSGLLAAAAVWHWRARTLPRTATATGIAAVVLIQLAAGVYRIREDGLRSSYLPAVRALESRVPVTGLVFGSGEFAFGLGFDGRLLDDPRLGFYSGRRPDAVVLDVRYRQWLDWLPRGEPEVNRYVRRMLDCRMQRVLANGDYQVYLLNPDRPACSG
jgi:4-amino-4-deoxy-L-arabinose transferase-like glycosyltransferase